VHLKKLILKKFLEFISLARFTFSTKKSVIHKINLVWPYDKMSGWPRGCIPLIKSFAEKWLNNQLGMSNLFTNRLILSSSGGKKKTSCHLLSFGDANLLN
jgi:hypothetical protein